MLVGRAAERERIDHLIDGAVRGAGGALAIRGEAGVGKSALLGYAWDRAGDSRKLRATGIASESELAFAGLLEVLRPILDRLDAIPQPQSAALRGALALGPPQRQDRFAIGAATLGLLAAAAEAQPLLVVVDDAHWLDGASLETLLFAARRIANDPVAVLVAIRTGEEVAVDLDGLPELQVSGLAAADTAQLAARASGSSLTPEQAQRVHRLTRGNPLAVLELAGRTGELELLDAPIPVSETVERAYASRAELLPEGARVALVVAAADDTGDVGVISAAVRRLGIEPGLLDDAESQGLVVIADGRLVFRHPLVRSAVYQRASAPVRRAAHAALAESMSDGDWQSGRRAWHRAAAAVEPDEEIAADLEATALEARQRSGYRAAALALQRSAGLTPDAETAAWRLYAAADAYWHAGQTDLVGDLLDHALGRSSDPLLRADVQHLRGRLAHFHGDPQLAYNLLVDEGVRVATADPRRAAEMLGNACHSFLYAVEPGHDLDVVLAALARIEALGGDAADPITVGLGAALVTSGRIDEAAPMLNRAVDILVEEYETRGDAHLLARAANCYGWLERYSAARELAARALDAARREGAAGTAAYCAEYLGEYERALGNPAAAIAAFEESHLVGRETGQPQVEAWAAMGLAHLAATQGRREDCMSYLSRAQDSGVPLMYLGHDIVGVVTGEQHLSEGDVEAAIAVMTRGINLEAELASYIPLLSPFDLIEAHVRAGHPDEAARIIERVAPHAHQRWARAALARCEGLLAADEAIDPLFQDAIGAFQQLGLPYEEARSRFCYGGRLRRAGRRVDARAQLHRALAEFERFGAAPLAERTRTELRASGETLRSRREEDGIGQLTPQELQVAQTVAAGATNKEAAAKLFLSTKTIEAHLHRTYRKLGITSREQLRSLVDPGDDSG